MATYQHHLIDEEFRQLADDARRRVRAIERSQPDLELEAHHDELLGRLAVYDFLHVRPFLKSRNGMISELRWYCTSDVPAPANAYNPNRFESSRFSHARALIARFEQLSSDWTESGRARDVEQRH